MSNRLGIDPKQDPDLLFISYLYCFDSLGKNMGFFILYQIIIKFNKMIKLFRF